MDYSQKILTPYFTDALKKLNRSQRDAVETIDGPVLVLAGPGTGKTEVLSLRVGQILSETDMQASNILCLTFSRAGVASMRKRLRELIGSESEKVTIETFHSFADTILKSNQGNGSNSRKLLTPAHRYLLLEKLLSRPETGGQYYDGRIPSKVRLSSLSRIFGLLKKEGISGGKLIALTNHCIENLLMNDPDYRATRVPLNEKGKRLRDQLVRFKDTIAPMFEAYQLLLQKHGYYDYEDLLDEASTFLRNQRDELLNLQMRYQYILVDEFQDTNDKQLEILLLLVSEIENPNLFIVGDDDQCIYRFQGASRRNFETIVPMFSNLRTIVLDTNYRSTADILSRAFSLIKENPGRDEIKSASLQTGIDSGWKLNPTAPLLRIYNQPVQEDYDIAYRLKQLMEDSSFTGTAAVLYRRHAESAAIMKWLDHWRIPYLIGSQRIDLLNTEGGKRLLWLVRIVMLLGKNNDLATTYFSNFALSYLGRDKYVKIHLQWKGQSEDISLFEWLHLQTDADSLVLGRVIKFCFALSEHLTQQISEEVLKDFLCYSDILAPGEEKAWFDWFDEFVRSDRKCTLSSFCSHLHYHEVMSLPIEYMSSDRTSARIILSTIWGSKGLEYDVVFVKGCLKRNWEDHQPPKQKVRVPHFLNWFVPDEPDALEDLRRLIYVAATRAKCCLAFSYTKNDERGKQQTCTELLSGLVCTQLLGVEDMNTIVPKLPRTFQPLPSDAVLRSLIRNRINQFSISPSSLYNWIESAEKFFIQNLCKIVAPPQLSLSLGSFMHKILEELVRSGGGTADFQRLRKVATEVFPRFVTEFHESHRSIAFEQAIRGVMEYWKENPLPDQSSELEKGLSADLPGGAKLYGILDRVEVTSDAVTIIDYKSGLFKQKLEPFRSEDDPGSGYWRQATIYSLLAEVNFPLRSIYEVQFHFIEQNKKEIFCEKLNREFIDWIMGLPNQMKELYEV
ncbi:MAG: ATP-dependent helicase [Bacteroidetes bacterium]|nr:ATP-dependent helicase [Bacteroidota bacterium]